MARVAHGWILAGLLASSASCGHEEHAPVVERSASTSAVTRTDTNRGRGADRARSEVAEESQDTERARIRVGQEPTEHAATKLDSEATELEATVDRACAGVPEPTRKTCPFEWSYTESVSETRDGVVIGLPSSLGPTSDVARRVDCRHAQAALQASRIPAAEAEIDVQAIDPQQCVLDVADVDARVSESDGRSYIELRSSNGRHLNDLRELARHQEGLRTTPRGTTTSH